MSVPNLQYWYRMAPFRQQGLTNKWYVWSCDTRLDRRLLSFEQHWYVAVANDRACWRDAHCCLERVRGKGAKSLLLLYYTSSDIQPGPSNDDACISMTLPCCLPCHDFIDAKSSGQDVHCREKKIEGDMRINRRMICWHVLKRIAQKIEEDMRISQRMICRHVSCFCQWPIV